MKNLSSTEREEIEWEDLQNGIKALKSQKIDKTIELSIPDKIINKILKDKKEINNILIRKARYNRILRCKTRIFNFIKRLFIKPDINNQGLTDKDFCDCHKGITIGELMLEPKKPKSP